MDIENMLISMTIKIREKLNPFLAPLRRKKLKNIDFTIISNNCWGGHVYRYFGLNYSSPTVGLYFWAEDYLLLLENLRSFFETEIQFINPRQSRYYSLLEKKGELNVPIGKLSCEKGNVEIVFLHYKSEDEAREKWNRRLKRVNYDNLIIKNSFMNACNDSLVERFDRLSYSKKIMFVNKKNSVYSSTVYIPGFDKESEIANDTNHFKKYVNLFRFKNGEGRL